MLEQPENYEPTEADIDMIVEDFTGKPVKPANLAAGIASMRQRIAQLEAEKTKLRDRQNSATDTPKESLTKHASAIDKELATARIRLAGYESQIGRQN
jgi:predicted  nucleic acid-binding Zn-ribbon protein